MALDRIAIRRAWDAVADTYAASRDPDGEDAALIDDLLAALPADARVLDVGCGDGARTLANLTGVEAVGLDISRRGLELATERVPGAHLVQGEMTALPLRANTFDGVTAYHAVFHVPRDEHPQVYREFARVLRPGGRVLMTVGSSRYQTVRRNWLGSGESMFFSTPGRAATTSQLREAGFEVVAEVTADDPLGSSVPFVIAELTA